MGTHLTDTLDISDSIQIDEARPSRGWKRMREIRRSDLAETEAMAAGLLAAGNSARRRPRRPPRPGWDPATAEARLPSGDTEAL
jgi:hypothetical protein